MAQVTIPLEEYESLKEKEKKLNSIKWGKDCIRIKRPVYDAFFYSRSLGFPPLDEQYFFKEDYTLLSENDTIKDLARELQGAYFELLEKGNDVFELNRQIRELERERGELIKKLSIKKSIWQIIKEKWFG